MPLDFKQWTKEKARLEEIIALTAGSAELFAAHTSNFGDKMYSTPAVSDIWNYLEGVAVSKRSIDDCADNYAKLIENKTKILESIRSTFQGLHEEKPDHVGSELIALEAALYHSAKDILGHPTDYSRVLGENMRKQIVDFYVELNEMITWINGIQTAEAADKTASEIDGTGKETEEKKTFYTAPTEACAGKTVVCPAAGSDKAAETYAANNASPEKYLLLTAGSAQETAPANLIPDDSSNRFDKSVPPAVGAEHAYAGANANQHRNTQRPRTAERARDDLRLKRHLTFMPPSTPVKDRQFSAYNEDVAEDYQPKRYDYNAITAAAIGVAVVAGFLLLLAKCSDRDIGCGMKHTNYDQQQIEQKYHDNK